MLVTPLQTRNELTHWDNRPFYIAWPQPQQRIPSGITKIQRKKKRVRTSFTTQQLITLEAIYSETRYITAEKRRELSQSLELGDRCIKVWFQNRRMKEKKELSDSVSDVSGEISSIESSSSPDYCKKVKPYEETSVSDNPFKSLEPSDYQITYNLHLHDQNDSEQSHDYSNMYPTEYYPNYGSGYCSNMSMQYQNQNTECANIANIGSWYADANNYFYCNN